MESKVSTRFGRFEIWHRRGTLTVDGRPNPISRRAFEILELLVSREGEIVTKEEIFSQVWQGLVVEESNLPVHVSALRKALGEDRDMITTVPGRGYVFSSDAPNLNLGPSPFASPSRPITPRSTTNLPRPEGRLIGRTTDLTSLKAHLHENRLLTLIGMGGIGKTRLAIELGGQVQGLFPDGVWFVDLAPLTDAAAVASAAATVLGAAVPNADTAIDAVSAAVGQRRMLLIFDNCEHVVAAVAELVEALLRHAPHLSILAASQAALHIEAEYLYRLQPLDMPPADAAGIETFGSVELFVIRAVANDRRFRVDADNADDICEICRRLEGVPLALEMAAARISLLGLKGLLAGFDERLRMLKFGPNSAEARYATLRAMVERSHDLLDDAEKHLFHRLAIFTGSFTLDAAIAVADQQHDRWDTINTLGQLIDKSLVVVDGGEPPRYRLLETLRIFGAEQLETSGVRPAIAERHAMYFADLFDRADKIFTTMPTDLWMECYRFEIDNVRSALKWAFGVPGRAPVAVRLVGAAARLWHALNLIGECKSYLDRAEALGETGISASDLARLWLEAGSTRRSSDRQHALALAEKSLVLYRQIDDRPKLAIALILQANLLSFFGRIEEAKRAAWEAHSIVFPGEPSQAQIAVANSLALIATTETSPFEARRWYLEAFELARDLKEEIRASQILIGLAEVEFALNEMESAIYHIRELLAVVRQNPVRRMLLPFVLVNLTSYLIYHGDLAEARTAAVEMFNLLLEERGFVMAVCLEKWALLGALDGKYRDAAKLSGFVNARYARTGEIRQLTEQRLYDRLQEVLSANLTNTELENCAAEGGKWTEDRAIRLAKDRFAAGGGRSHSQPHLQR